MHLIETPVRLNASLHKMIPRTINYLYGKTAIKFFKTYTLDAVHIYYIDAFSEVDVIMMADKRKIKSEEIDFTIDKLFPEVSRTELTVDPAAKAKVEARAKRKLQYHDVVIIQQKRK
ncbi:DUF1827 family protein [Agrilactobacillus fermenti]|uniref:DUF1827 family protein n=1 Tax=Agrilactobacillus fermenti TaxID=2586909 RepID=UPI001E4D8B3E|nr:DUF1827 family protein [Agrilactobacillus fermenti]MCD2256753.1 DUF1827 family protein [Agrilactobacillus fermenti]